MHVCLNDLPIKIDPDTGIIIKADINKTPTILMNNDMNIANIIVITYCNNFVFTPEILA